MKVSFNDLEDAFTSANDETYHWLDRETGKIIFFDEELRQSLINGEELLGWQKEMAEDARPVLIALGEIDSAEETGKIEADRYVEIVPPGSDENWKIREDFAIFEVENEDLREKLIYALRGGKPFRKFKNVLENYPEERGKWFAYEKERLREYIEDWAEREGVEIDFEN